MRLQPVFQGCEAVGRRRRRGRGAVPRWPVPPLRHGAARRRSGARGRGGARDGTQV